MALEVVVDLVDLGEAALVVEEDTIVEEHQDIFFEQLF